MLLGISRKGRPIRKQIRRTIIREGDMLLVLVPKESFNEVINWIGCLPLAARGLNITDTSKMTAALSIFFVGLIVASVGLYLEMQTHDEFLEISQFYSQLKLQRDVFPEQLSFLMEHSYLFLHSQNKAHLLHY